MNFGLRIMLAVVFLVSAGAAFTAERPVYVILFMHNEDSALPMDFTQPNAEASYERQRAGLVEFGDMLRKYDVPFCWQSDWTFLEGVLYFDNEQRKQTTNGKNLVRYLSEDCGVTIDPHSHENYGRNYADVAHLIDSLGVQPTDVIGGHAWDPYNSGYMDWERFRDPLGGQFYPHASWEGRILTGTAVPGHGYDPEASGIWRPTDKYNYWQDDPNGNLAVVGHYKQTLQGLNELIGLIENDEVDEDEILTCAFFTPQSITPNFCSEYYTETLEPLLNLREQNKIEIVTFDEVVDIWESDYGANAHLYNAPPDTVPDEFAVRLPGVGNEGTYALVTLPEEPRYGDTAPVVVHVPGGWDGAGATSSGFGFTEHGFVEITFNFPGSGVPAQHSAGSYDERGPNCIAALAEVAQFALGETTDVYGYRLADMTGELVPDGQNAGVCGWSNGGNATIVAAGAFADELQNLAWIVNWESPVGDGMPNVDCGGNSRVNPAYEPATGTFDWSLLAYSPDVPQTDFSNGGLYFDVNGDGSLQMGTDFGLTAHPYDNKLYYSLQAREAAAQAGLSLPAWFATLPECRDFWHWRNGTNWYDEIVAANPDVMFMVEAGDRDHVQGAPDHPHIREQYEGFRLAGARFVRLNPDQSYVEDLLGQSVPDAPDNDAFVAFDDLTLPDALEPRGPQGVLMKIGVGATLCEVADRTRFNELGPQVEPLLTAVSELRTAPTSHQLCNYPNPFNSSTRFEFELDTPQTVSLAIYNVLGQCVKTWDFSQLAAGAHSVHWNGRDAGGRPSASGLYIARLFYQDHTTATHKIQLLQ